MSTQPRAEFVAEELSEQAVHDYLAAHPDFFEQHAALLDRLNLPHASGSAVSLIERQVSMLRQKDLKLERQLKDLIQVARENDVLAAKIHELALQLMAAGDLGSTVAAIEEALRSGFGADQAVLVLFGNADLFDDIDAGRFFRVVQREDESLSPFSTFLEGSSARCGRIRDSQRDFLFHQDANDIGSGALVPLGDDAEIGFLAVGSVDGDHFHPGMSIDFLTRLGDMIAVALKRF
ncbi:MAG: DUF484 family protein [Gammaproteobacteria bacterium]|nr:DUF484 family protein [Gammaproteobacteria bacterium]NNF50594.1 DUF484 family protein [Woeseiaceae bacterium]MBT8093243.1 DUF484 family protein [Gammaproteobacteria bacterium]MBT8106049.1 DUF484 family protein [Gammaproteobacteria bacterium]NNK26063.1 DUF484 family protein [Woeseiaceae bacterium]